MFDAFFQVDVLRPKLGGTGIGFAISKRLIEMMGGSIGVESVPGKGSEFFSKLRLESAGDGFKIEAPWAEESGPSSSRGTLVGGRSGRLDASAHPRGRGDLGRFPRDRGPERL